MTTTARHTSLFDSDLDGDTDEFLFCNSSAEVDNWLADEAPIDGILDDDHHDHDHGTCTPGLSRSQQGPESPPSAVETSQNLNNDDDDDDEVFFGAVTTRERCAHVRVSAKRRIAGVEDSPPHPALQERARSSTTSIQKSQTQTTSSTTSRPLASIIVPVSSCAAPMVPVEPVATALHEPKTRSRLASKIAPPKIHSKTFTSPLASSPNVALLHSAPSSAPKPKIPSLPSRATTLRSPPVSLKRSSDTAQSSAPPPKKSRPSPAAAAIKSKVPAAIPKTKLPAASTLSKTTKKVSRIAVRGTRASQLKATAARSETVDTSAPVASAQYSHFVDDNSTLDPFATTVRVANSPPGGTHDVPRSKWSPVKKRRPLTFEEETSMCTKTKR